MARKSKKAYKFGRFIGCRKHMEKEDLYREIQTRIGLIEVMIIVGGFIVAYSDKTIRSLTSSIFILFTIFALLYYVFLTRTKNEYVIFLNGFYSSFLFSFLIEVFSIQHAENNIVINFCVSLIALMTVFTFALLPPSISEKLTDKWREKLKSIEVKNPRVLKVLLFMILTMCILAVVISLYNLYR